MTDHDTTTPGAPGGPTPPATADERLAALPEEPTELHPPRYSPVHRAGNVLNASGQVAMRGGKIVTSGLVGRDVTLEDAQKAAWLCATNLLTAVRDHVGSLDRVRAHRITVYVQSAPGFTDQHLVGHGASEALVAVLGPDRGGHGRSALGLAALPLDSAVEVDGVFLLEDDSENLG
ncbi:RidA family protein [Brachybacterium huguangmaarense]